MSRCQSEFTRIGIVISTTPQIDVYFHEPQNPGQLQSIGLHGVALFIPIADPDTRRVSPVRRTPVDAWRGTETALLPRPVR